MARFSGSGVLVDTHVVSALIPAGQGASRFVSLSLDLGAPQTTFAAPDLGLDPVPPDDALSTIGGRAVGAAVSFHDLAHGRVGFLRPVLITNGPPGSSRIGCDILDSWLIVIDRSEGTLILEPRAWDLGPAGTSSAPPTA